MIIPPEGECSLISAPAYLREIDELITPSVRQYERIHWSDQKTGAMFFYAAPAKARRDFYHQQEVLVNRRAIHLIVQRGGPQFLIFGVAVYLSSQDVGFLERHRPPFGRRLW